MACVAVSVPDAGNPRNSIRTPQGGPPVPSLHEVQGVNIRREGRWLAGPRTRR